MELEHSFIVPLSEEQAWDVLLDVERVAPCMPGATLDSVDGDVIKGRIKVKVGPIAMVYTGTARITERDPDAHLITMEAAGRETRGAGTASATVRQALAAQPDGQTRVTVATTLNVTGRPAQFGRGVLADVGGKLIGIFADNLAKMLAEDQPEPEAAGTAAVSTSTQEEERSQPLDVLSLPAQSYNTLRREGVDTVGGLASKTAEQLLAIDTMDQAAVDEIRHKLADHGLTLREPPAPEAPATAEAPGTAAETSAAPAAEPQPAAAASTRSSARDKDDDAINLISVAGMPVLKRAIPVAAALVAAALVALRLRLRHRRR